MSPVGRNELTRLFIVVGAQTKDAVNGLSKLDKRVAVTARRMRALGRTMTGVAAGTAAVVGAIGALAVRGTRVTNVTRGFENATRDQILALQQLRSATQFLLSDYELMVGFNRALTLGAAQNARQFAQLSQTAISLGRALGLDARFAIESLSLGIGRASRLLLDNLGIVISMEKAYQDYADAIGVSVEALDEQQKKTAILNAATEAAADKIDELGGFQLTLGDQVVQLGTAFKNLADAIAKSGDQGGVLGTIFKGITQIIRGATNSINSLTRLLGGDAPTDLDRRLEAFLLTPKLRARAGGEEGLTAFVAEFASEIERLRTLRDARRQLQEQVLENDSRAIMALAQLDAQGPLTFNIDGKTFEFETAFVDADFETVFEVLSRAFNVSVGELSDLRQELADAEGKVDDVTAAFVRFGSFSVQDIFAVQRRLADLREELDQLVFEGKEGIPADQLEDYNNRLAEATRKLAEFTQVHRELFDEIKAGSGSFADFAAMVEAFPLFGITPKAAGADLVGLQGPEVLPGLQGAIRSAEQLQETLLEQEATLLASNDGTQEWLESWEELNRQIANVQIQLRNLKKIQDAITSGGPVPSPEELEQLIPKGGGLDDPSRFPLGKFNSALNIAVGALSVFNRELADIAQGFGQVTGQIGLATTTKGFEQVLAIGGAIGAGVGLLANIVGDLFSSNSELQRAIVENTAALRDLTEDLKGTADALRSTGLSDEELVALAEALAPFQGKSLEEIAERDFARLRDTLQRLNLDFGDLEALARALGFEFENVGQVLGDLGEALALLFDLTQKKLAEARAAIEIFDIEDPARQAEIMFQVIAQKAAAITDPVFKAFAADLFKDVDLSTPEGIAAFNEQIEDIFRLWRADLLDPRLLGFESDEAFLAWLMEVERLGDAAGEAADQLERIGDQNVPAGFKLLRQFREFEAMDAILDPRLISATTSQPNVPNPDAGTVITGGGAYVAVDTVNVFGVQDIEELRRQLAEISRRDNMRERRSRFGDVRV